MKLELISMFLDKKLLLFIHVIPYHIFHKRNKSGPAILGSEFIYVIYHASAHK